MTVTRRKRPRDPVQLGRLIVELATGQVEDREDDGKDAAAAEMGRKGGAARAAKLTPDSFLSWGFGSCRDRQACSRRFAQPIV
jgi:hypothetical protein